MTETLYRAVPDLELRSRAQGGDGRTVAGIVVPYAKAQKIDASLTEQFARGAFNHQLSAANRVVYTRDHMAHGGSLIGRAVMLRDDAAGLYGEFRVSRTSLGDETLALIEDGVLSHMSIGFRARQDRQLRGGITERVKADLFEVAVVLQGAYGDAATVAEVREAYEEEDGTPNLDRARQILGRLPVIPT